MIELNKRLSIVIAWVAVALFGAAVYLFLRSDVEVPVQQDGRVGQVDAIEPDYVGDASVDSKSQDTLASDTKALMRADVAAVLGKLRDAQSVSELRNALSDSHSDIRAQAADALGRLGHPSVIPDLVSALSDSVFLVRIRAAYALASMDYIPRKSERNRYTRALDEFQSVVTDAGIMADDAHMHLDVGQYHEINNAYDRALEHYRYALRFAPDLTEAQDRIKRLNDENIRYNKLVDMVTPVIEKDVRAQVALGLAYVHRGKLENGVAFLQKAVNAGVHSEIVETGLGDAQRKLGNFDVAKTHYETALKMGSGSPGAHRGLALLAYSDGNVKSGQVHWDHFVQAQSNVSDGVKQLMEKR